MDAHLILSAAKVVLLLIVGGPDSDRTETEPAEPAGRVTINGEPAPDGIGTIGDISNQTVTDSMTFETIRRGSNK